MVEKLQSPSRFACICICVYVCVSGSASMENLLWLGAKDELILTRNLCVSTSVREHADGYACVFLKQCDHLSVFVYACTRSCVFYVFIHG